MATILVIESDKSTRIALCDLLRDYDHRPIGVASGHDALDLMETGLRPDVIVLELVMPVMDGRAFRAEQLRRPHLAKIPVVVISASDLNLRDTADQVQNVDLLAKPIPSDVLMSLIRQFSARGPSPG